MMTVAQLRADPFRPRQNDDTTRIVFTFDAPNAKAVSLVGSFNDWNLKATPMWQGPEGQWHAHLHLPAGLHKYRFVINGERWVADPRAKLCAHAPDGKQNSVLAVRGAEVVSP